MSERICHEGVPIDNLDPKQAIYHIIDLLRTNNSRNHLVTLGIATYLEARLDSTFRDILNTAALVIPESTGLSLYSHFHPPTLVNTPGGQLARDCLTICGELGKTIAVFGSSEDSRREAIKILNIEDPKLKLVNIEGEYNFTNSTDSQYVASQLDKMSPDFAIMAGNEIDAERWINHWIVHSGINVKLVGNFGQTVDVWGKKNRSRIKYFAIMD